MNHSVSLIVLVILQLISSVGSFLNSLPLVYATLLSISNKEQQKLFVVPIIGGVLLLGLLFILCLSLVELALGSVGVILTYGLWKQKNWAWTPTFVLQIITVFLAVFYLFPTSSGEEKWNNVQFFLNIFRIIISSAALTVYFFISR